MSKRNKRIRKQGRSVSKSIQRLSYGMFQVQYVTLNPNATQEEIDAEWENTKERLIAENRALNAGSLSIADKDGSISVVQKSDALSVKNRVEIRLPNGQMGSLSDLMARTK